MMSLDVDQRDFQKITRETIISLRNFSYVYRASPTNFRVQSRVAGETLFGGRMCCTYGSSTC
jgi:hypothetical protein